MNIKFLCFSVFFINSLPTDDPLHLPSNNFEQAIKREGVLNDKMILAQRESIYNMDKKISHMNERITKLENQDPNIYLKALILCLIILILISIFWLTSIYSTLFSEN